MVRDKIKINLLTFNRALSYGAVLQTYALTRVLEELNCDVQLIDFRAPFLPPLPTGIWSLKTNYNLTRLRKEMVFSKFRRKYLNKKTKAFLSLSGLKKFKFNADYYVVGSDQVWNPDITKKYVYVYFLNFIKGKKISYAASFGKSDWNCDETTKNEINKLLDDFLAISLREAESLQTLSNSFGKLGTHALDPTLLLNDYSEFVPDVSLKEQISCIVVNKSNVVVKITSKLQIETGLPAFALDTKIRFDNINPVPFVSVPNWLRYIAESKYVVTDSFHGVAFCLIFQKQFIAVNTNAPRFIRIKDLLASLDLSDRIIENDYKSSIAGFIARSIDYSTANQKLDKMKSISIGFLLKHLV